MSLYQINEVVVFQANDKPAFEAIVTAIINNGSEAPTIVLKVLSVGAAYRGRLTIGSVIRMPEDGVFGTFRPTGSRRDRE